jgi:hypothetical protein
MQPSSSSHADRTWIAQKPETPKARAGECASGLGLRGGAGDGNRTRMTSLEEMLGTPCVVVLAPSTLARVFRSRPQCPLVPLVDPSMGHATGTRPSSGWAVGMPSLEEGSPQGWGVLVVLAELPPAVPSNPSRSAPCRTRVASEDHDRSSSPGRCLPVRSSPSAAPLLAISRVSGVVWFVVVVIAPLAAPGAPSTSDANRLGLDD